MEKFNVKSVQDLIFEFQRFDAFSVFLRKEEKTKEIYAIEISIEGYANIDTEWLFQLDRAAFDSGANLKVTLQNGKLAFRFESLNG